MKVWQAALTTRQVARVMRTVSERLEKPVIQAMSRDEYAAACRTVAQELYPSRYL